MMKTFKSIVACLVFSLVLMSSLAISVDASGGNNEDNENIMQEGTSREEGECLEFEGIEVDDPTIDDDEVYVTEEGEVLTFKSDDSIQPRATKSYSKGDLIYRQYSRSELLGTLYRRDAHYYSTSNVSRKFVKYLTGSWAYSDGYTWSRTNTTTITGSGESGKTFAKKVTAKLGFSVSYSTSYSVAVHIPAVETKLSKLGFASDYKKIVYDYKYYKDGTLKESSRDTYYAPKKDTYLLVYYK